MTDLITDPVDRAMVRDMNGPLGDVDPIPAPMVAPTQPEPAPEPTLDEATIKLLTDLGFDHVPTIEEAKARLDARREEIREAVMFQADRRNWCEDGTRQVCANLRVRRPGLREERTVTVRATVEFTKRVVAYSDKGALLLANKGGYLPLKAGDRFGGSGTHMITAEIHEVKIGDETVELTDALREEITNA